MSQSRARIKGNSRRRGRGVGFLFFVTVAIPFFIFSGILALDAGDIIVANRDVINAAESAALAGAGQINHGVLITDPSQCLAGTFAPCTAMDVALATFQVERTSGALPNISIVSGPVITTGVINGVQTVEVTVTYRANALFFNNIPIFGALESTTHQVTEAAFVCDAANKSNPTGGVCSAPQILF